MSGLHTVKAFGVYLLLYLTENDAFFLIKKTDDMLVLKWFTQWLGISVGSG